MVAMFQLDHIVHYVNDLRTGVEAFESAGLHAFYGGSHEEWGTYNALSYFGLTYVEWLAMEERDKVVQSSKSNVLAKDALHLLPNNEVINRIAIRTNNIEKVAEQLRKHHIDVLPIVNGSRRDQKGRLIEWKMLMIDGNYEKVVYPFFIQWEETDEERLNRLSLKPHPIGDITFAEVLFRVNNPKKIATHWHDIFQFPIIEKDDGIFRLQIADKYLVFQKGERNGISEARLHTTNEKMKGKSVQIGEGKYVFIK